MKKILFALLFILPFCIFAQTGQTINFRRTASGGSGDSSWVSIEAGSANTDTIFSQSAPDSASIILNSSGIALPNIKTVLTTPSVLTADASNIVGKASATQSDQLNWVQVRDSLNEYTIKGADYTATSSDVFIEMTNATDTLILPVGVTGLVFHVINVTGGDITVDGNGAEEIGNASTAATLTISTGTSASLIFNGTAWRVF